MNYQTLFNLLRQNGFDKWADQLERDQQLWFSDSHHGDYARWAEALENLPEIESVNTDFSTSKVTVQGLCENHSLLKESLAKLKPWRKGPFQISDVFIDTEWRSDFKWDRVSPHLGSLNQRKILDIGCGNGYHCWRMLDSDPELVVGIDPSVLFNLQFQAVQRYVNDDRIYLLPLTIQQMPENMQWFDSVFSMGVLYHRRSPFDHLMQIKGLLKEGGELCLETLVIEGGEGHVLVPGPRYARMNNVWFLPSADELAHWLGRCGFKDIRVVDISQTSLQEQRTTEWMPFESLEQCLDPDNRDLTVEGYPAPRRAFVLATK